MTYMVQVSEVVKHLVMLIAFQAQLACAHRLAVSN